MPRSFEIDQFGERLSLMRNRLTLSRAPLAHSISVEKPVAAHWVLGCVRTGDQSIVRLTELARREIASFSRSHRNQPRVGFSMHAARSGGYGNARNRIGAAAASRPWGLDAGIICAAPAGMGGTE